MTNLSEQAVVPSHPSYRLIPLTKGKYAIVDAADYDWLNQWLWCFSHGYALRREKGRVIWMHNLILNTPKRKRGDHWNGDSLDNRRVNLRILTTRGNAHNSRISKNNTSGCTGVYFYKDRNRWTAYITPPGKKRITLGEYEVREEAIALRKAAERRYYGEVIRDICPDRIVLTPAIINAAIRSNRVNTTSGITGVSVHRGTQKFMARVFADKTTYYLGLFSSAMGAKKAIDKFKVHRGLTSSTAR